MSFRQTLAALAAFTAAAVSLGAPAPTHADYPAEQYVTVDAVTARYSLKELQWRAPSVVVGDAVDAKDARAASDLLQKLRPTIAKDAAVVFPDGTVSSMSVRETRRALAAYSSSLATLEVRLYQKKKSGRCGIGYNGILTCVGPKAWSFGSKTYSAAEITKISLRAAACDDFVAKGQSLRISFYVCRVRAVDGTVAWEVISARSFRRPDVAPLEGAQTRVIRADGLLVRGSSPVTYLPSGRLSFSASSYSLWTDNTAEKVTVEFYYRPPNEKGDGKWVQIAANAAV